MMDDEDEKSVNKPDNSIQELFYKAIKESDWDLFLATVQNDKVDVNLRNDDNELPIFMAFTQVYKARTDVAKNIFFRLLEAVKIEQPNKEEQLLGFKDKTLNDNGNNLLTKILSSDDGYKLLSNYRGDIPDIVTYLINEKGLRADHANNISNTALHLVVTHSEIPASAIKLLIDKGADVNALNEFEDTPILLGRASGAITTEQVAMLLDYKANTDLKSIDGHDVINIGTEETTKVLIAYGYLMDSVRLDELVRYVIKFNSDPPAIFKLGIKDDDGNPITVNYQTPDGKSLFALAQEYGRDDVKLAIALEVYKTDKDSSLLAELCQEMGLDALLIALNKGFQKSDADLVFYMIDAQGEAANLQPGEDIKNASLTGETIEPDAIEAI